MEQNRHLVEKESDFSPRERRNRILEELLLASPQAKNLQDIMLAIL